MRYLLFVSKLYGYSIVRPVQKAIRARGDEVAWFVHDVSDEHLRADEKQLKTVAEVMDYNPDAVFVASNWVPYFFPGAKALDIKTPILLTGGNRSVDYLEKLLNTGEIDFISMSRPLIREPDLPNRWLAGTGGNKADCISCNGCFEAIMQGKTAYCTQI